MNPSYITLLILLFTVILFVTDKTPMSVTAMLCCTALAVTGVITPQEAFGFFGNTTIILFAAMFVIGYAFFETGMAKQAGTFITKFTKTERQLVFVLMAVSGGLSMVLSNTGTTAVFIPIVIGLAAGSGFSNSRLLYSMVVAVGMGGMGSLLGGPGWLYVKAQVEMAVPGSNFGFFEPSKIGIPMFFIALIFMVTIGYKMVPDKKGEVAEFLNENDEDKEENIIPAWKGKMSAAVLVLTILAMIFEKNIGIPLWLSAVIGALVLVVSGVITEQEAYKAISWKTLFLFAGILPLSTALAKTGAGQMIADAMLKMMGNTTNPFIITAVLMLIPTVMTNFMSNAATAALLTPLGISLALGIGADPTAVIMAISVGAGFAIATPIGQPGNAMIYGPSGLSFRDYMKAGLPLTLIMYVVGVFLVPYIWPFF
jgi:anion transporter